MPRPFPLQICASPRHLNQQLIPCKSKLPASHCPPQERLGDRREKLLSRISDSIQISPAVWQPVPFNRFNEVVSEPAMNHANGPTICALIDGRMNCNRAAPCAISNTDEWVLF